MWTIETIKRETSKLVHTLRHVGLEHDNSDVIDTKRVETTEEGCIITSVLYNIEFDFRHLTVVITTLNGTTEKYHVSILTKACRDIVKRIDEMLTNYKEYFEETEEIDEPHTPTLDFEYRNLMYTDEYKAAHNDNTKYLMETHSLPPTHEPTFKKVHTSSIYGMFPTIPDMHNNKCFCCPADRQGNRCGGEKWCKETWKRYEAIIKPEWHNVSLTTLANIDFDMLDEKRQTYLTAFRDLQKTLSYLRKCKTQDTYDTCFIRYIRRKNMLWAEGKISNAMWKFIEAKLSMQNVESGVWASKCEESTGYHESRRYNKSRVGK